MSQDKPTVLMTLQTYAEFKAAQAHQAARQYIGVDRESDAFEQGRFQAYRDMAHMISQEAK